MATLNFPDDPSTGDVYTDGNSGFSYEWNGTVWISKDPSTVSNIREIDNISSGFDGSDTTFTLQVAGVNVEPANVQQLIISVGGVMQNAGQDFTLSGSTLTFTTAPTSGLTFFGVLLGTALSLNTVADASVGSAALKVEDFTIGGSSNTVTIPGNLTVQGTETIINTNELNVQDKTVGIASTNAPTSASQDDAGIIIYGQTPVNILYDRDKSALGINTALSVTGVITATTFSGDKITVNNGTSEFGDDVQFTMTAGNILFDKSASLVQFNDDVKATWGNSGVDLTIYHTNTGQIDRIDSGNKLEIRANASTKLLNDDGSTTYAIFNEGGSNDFYYADSKKVETTGIGASVLGTLVSTAATIGTGVTISNTGIDAGNTGIVTAGTMRLGTTTEGEASADNLTIADSANCGITIRSGTSNESNIFFSDGTSGSAEYMGAIQYKHGTDSLEVHTNATEKLKISSTGGFQFSNGLFDERVKITAGKLSNNTNIDLENGMVHYFTTQETTTATPNIRINASSTLQGAMDTGDVCTVTLITTAAAAGYSANLTIDGNAVTEEWVGGSAPSAGSDDGLDIYTYTIICIGTGTGDSGFKVIGNLTNATN